jgi:phosphopantetheine adenylyltransferase
MAMKSETVEAFIAEAEKELASILRRKTELEELIKKCKSLFGGEPRQLSLSSEILISSETSNVNLNIKNLRRKRGKKIWEQIVDLLKEVGEPLSISEIVQGFIERKWPLSDKNASKIIYRAMKDKPNIFINTNQGTWDLKKVQPRPPMPPHPTTTKNDT